MESSQPTWYRPRTRRNNKRYSSHSRDLEISGRSWTNCAGKLTCRHHWGRSSRWRPSGLLQFVQPLAGNCPWADGPCSFGEQNLKGSLSTGKPEMGKGPALPRCLCTMVVGQLDFLPRCADVGLARGNSSWQVTDGHPILCIRAPTHIFQV